MARSVSIAEARATLTECIRDAERGETVVITRRGRAVAGLVPVESLDQLARHREVKPAGGLASLAGGWEGSAELVRILDSSPRIG
jgi:prevent-host-death family protein